MTSWLHAHTFVVFLVAFLDVLIVRLRRLLVERLGLHHESNLSHRFAFKRIPSLPVVLFCIDVLLYAFAAHDPAFRPGARVRLGLHLECKWA